MSEQCVAGKSYGATTYPCKQDKCKYEIIPKTGIISIALIILVGVIHPSTGHHQCLVEGRDLEAEGFLLAATAHGHGSGLDVDAHGGVVIPGMGEDQVQIGLGQFYGGHATVEHVLAEDAGKGLGDYGGDTVDLEDPGRVFPGRTTAKVGAGEDYPGIFRSRPFCIETGQFQVFQNIGFKIFLGDLGQVLGRNDLVGVYVAAVEKEDRASECFHMFTP